MVKPQLQLLQWTIEKLLQSLWKKRESITATTGKRKNVSLGDKTQVKCLTGRYRLTSIGLNNLSEHEK